MGKTNSKPRQNRLNLNYEILSTEGNTIHLVDKDTQQLLILKTFSADSIKGNPGILPII
jgi:hypothetical protein